MTGGRALSNIFFSMFHYFRLKNARSYCEDLIGCWWRVTLLLHVPGKLLHF